MNWLVGTSTLPPRWPHFFSEASWSSKCTPAAPASIIAFISSKAFSGPPKPASASATIGASQCVPRSPSAQWIWSARSSALLIRRTSAGARVRRVEALVGIGVPGEVRVGGDLPAGDVDRLRPGLDHLHRLAAGERAERGDVRLGRAGAARAARRRAARACARPRPSRAAARRRPPCTGARCRASGRRAVSPGRSIHVVSSSALVVVVALAGIRTGALGELGGRQHRRRSVRPLPHLGSIAGVVWGFICPVCSISDPKCPDLGSNKLREAARGGS